MKKLLENAKAEQEANDVGIRYMNSSDVLGDMRRDYGSAVAGVKVHDDAAADAKVRAAGRDGIASGKDVYMREGSLSSNAPEVKGLLAHEVTHTMQQSGGTTGKSVNYGSEQGGFIDLFRRKKKEEPKEEKVDYGPDVKTPEDIEFAKAYREAFSEIGSDDMLEHMLGDKILDADYDEEHPLIYQQMMPYYGKEGGPTYAGKDSYAVAKAIERTSSGVAKSEYAKKMIAQTFANSLHQRLQLDGLRMGTQEEKAAAREAVFTSADTGELQALNMFTQKMMPEGYQQELGTTFGGVDTMEKISEDMSDGGSLSGVTDFLGSFNADDVFYDIPGLDSNPEAQSQLFMGNFVQGMAKNLSRGTGNLAATGQRMERTLADPSKRSQTGLFSKLASRFRKR